MIGPSLDLCLDEATRAKLDAFAESLTAIQADESTRRAGEALAADLQAANARLAEVAGPLAALAAGLESPLEPWRREMAAILEGLSADLDLAGLASGGAAQAHAVERGARRLAIAKHRRLILDEIAARGWSPTALRRGARTMLRKALAARYGPGHLTPASFDRAWYDLEARGLIRIAGQYRRGAPWGAAARRREQ